MELETVAMGYIIHDSRILLVKHKKSGRFMSCGGHVEKNELVQDALIREVKEELNLDVEIIHEKQFENLTTELATPFNVCYKELPNGNKVQIFEYLCKVKSLENLKLLKCELDEYKWFSLEDTKNSEDITPIVKEILIKILQ